MPQGSILSATLFLILKIDNLIKAIKPDTDASLLVEILFILSANSSYGLTVFRNGLLGMNLNFPHLKQLVCIFVDRRVSIETQF